MVLSQILTYKTNFMLLLINHLKLNILLLVALIFSYQTIAQIGIGTTTPEQSSILHIASHNKGLLIPQIALTDTVDITSIVDPADHLVVFNTSTSGGLTEGLYYWNDGESKWYPVTNVSFFETKVLDTDSDDGLSDFENTLGYDINTGNGLQLVADSVGLGGALSQATTISTSSTNTLSFLGLENRNTSALTMVVDTSSGVIGFESFKTQKIHAEYPGAVIYDGDSDMMNSEGTMIGTYHDGLQDNVYEWTTTSLDAGGEEFRVSFLWSLPSDFSQWDTTGTNITFNSVGGTTTISASTLSGTTSISGSGTNFTASDGTAGDVLRFEIIMNATSGDTARVGTVDFSYR